MLEMEKNVAFDQRINEKKTILPPLFGKKEFKWRAGAASFWIVVLVPFVLILFEFLIHTTILHPVAWFRGGIGALFSWQFPLTTFCVQVLCFPIIIFHYKCTKVHPVQHKHKWNELLFLLNPKQLLWILVNGFLGSLLTLVLYSLSYEVISTQYFQNGLNEPVKYLIFFGCILGLRYGVCFYKEKKYVLTFPVLQELRLVRFRASISLCCKSAILECLQTLKLCFILYCIVGFLEKSLDFLLDIKSDGPSLISSDSLLFSVYLTWLCFTLGTTILLLFNLAESLFKIFTTQAYTFCLETNFVGDQRLLLQDALISNHEIIKHLAFLDLCEVSKNDSCKRKKIFSITQPGGHAETWNRILPECLALIANSKQRFVSMSQLKKEADNSAGNLFSPRKATLGGTLSSPLFSPNKTFGENGTPRSRQQSASLFSPGKTWSSTEDVKSPRKSHNTPRKTKEVPDLKSQELSQDLQLITWVLEGLSLLVCASFTEDTFGVVQRNLPDILVSFLSYLETIELYLKTTVSDERLQMNKAWDFKKKKSTVGVAQSYRIAVQSALYRITSKFGKNLQSLRLPVDHKKRINAFLEFQD